MTPARKSLAAAILAVILWAAVVIQLTVVNRIPFPGAAVPDLVLLLVTAIAVTVPAPLAAVTGFAGGLALDIAPPAAHYAGEYALVFCLAAYVASRVNHAISNATGERDPVAAFTVMAVAAAAGETGKVALGMLLSDPDVGAVAVSRVLPGAILYDLVLSPLAFLLVVRVTRAADSWSTGPERAPALEFSPGHRAVSAFRQASVGAAPGLRLAGTGAAYGSPKNHPPKYVAGRVPKLRLSDARAHSVSRTAAASPGSSPLPSAAGRTKKLNFAGDLPVRTAARPARTPGKNWLRSAPSPAMTATKQSARGPARGWLRPGAGGLAEGVTTGSAAAGHPGRRTAARPRRFASSFRGSRRPVGSPVAASRRRTPDEALAARSAPSALSGTARRAPRAGWLSGTRSASGPAVAKTPRTGWLGSARGRPRTVIGSAAHGRTVTGAGPGMRKGAFRRRRTGAGGTWHAASPAGPWPRRGRNPWRARSQRLLRMMRMSK